ncbi:hypothetical protein [Gallionella capsiferriformans]|uniref:Integrase family protein n=1 Tax=Gallionella capsiferriformans (strain ES-2) TaxID=395494 RepID=D9SK08_GALCS|nr:hypothetical protein [Gallionella capsiferriformans]ADL56420.1 hypothetical protein Galf_2420 [Gallionella capsiferriformans ES-2]
MSKVVSFIPVTADDPKKNLADFVTYCRDTLALYEDQGGFAVHQWIYTDANGRKHAMRFAEYSKKNDPYNYTPFHEPFLSFAQAYVRFHQEQQQVTSIGNKTSALATVYDALRDLGRSQDIMDVDGVVISKTSELIRQRNSEARRYHIGNELEMLANFLREKAICPSLPIWTNPYPRQRFRAQGTTAEDKAWQEERCPSIHQMLALADIFRMAEEEYDQYWSSVIVLLMFAPGRGSEPGSLMVDSLIEEDGRLKVLWFPKKKAEWTKKIVPVQLEPVVRDAFARLIKIGKSARIAAKFAFENPGKFMRHSRCITPVDFGEDEPLDVLQFSCAMNYADVTIEKLKIRQQEGKDLQGDDAWRVINPNPIKWLENMRASGPVTYRRLAELTHDKYCTHSWPNMPRSNRPVWDSLLLVLDMQFHADFLPKQFSWVIPNINALNCELGGRDYQSNSGKKLRIKSIFDRFNKVDEDGKTPIMLTSHQPRVWLSTWAERGGMSAWLLAQWAGRANKNDNKAYKFLTKEEKDKAAKDVIRHNQAPTSLEAVRLNLPVTYESLGIDRPGVAHPTLYGFCVRDWAMAPCLKGGGEACASCDDHKCIKGLDDKLENLESLESGLSRELSRAALQLDVKTFGADSWFRFLGFRLGKIRAIISRLKDLDTPEGAHVCVPPELDPSPLQRARSAVVPEASDADQQSVRSSMTKKFLGWVRHA